MLADHSPTKVAAIPVNNVTASGKAKIIARVRWYLRNERIIQNLQWKL
ncbi:hypothetical protein [Nostoc sp. C110]